MPRPPVSDEVLFNYAFELVGPLPPPPRTFLDAARQLEEWERTDPLDYGQGLSDDDAFFYCSQLAGPERAREAVAMAKEAWRA